MAVVKLNATAVNGAFQPNAAKTTDGLTVTTDGSTTEVLRVDTATYAGDVWGTDAVKRYFEVTLTTQPTGQFPTIGLCDIGHDASIGQKFIGQLSALGYSGGGSPQQYNGTSSWNDNGGTGGGPYASRASNNGDVIAFCYDVANRRMWTRNVTAGDTWMNASADPAAGTGYAVVSGGSLGVAAGDKVVPCIAPNAGSSTGSGSYTFNFGASAFVGAVPSGFSGLDSPPPATANPPLVLPDLPWPVRGVPQASTGTFSFPYAGPFVPPRAPSAVIAPDVQWQRKPTPPASSGTFWSPKRTYQVELASSVISIGPPTTSPQLLSCTVPSGLAGGYLVVGVETNNTSVPTSVTYSGQSMTLLNTFNGWVVGNCYIYGLASPPSGTANVTVNWNVAPSGCYGISAICYAQVASSGPTNISSATVTSTSQTATLPGSDGDGVYVQFAMNSPSTGSSSTSDIIVTPGGNVPVFGYGRKVNATQSVTENQLSSLAMQYQMMSLPLAPAPAATPNYAPPQVIDETFVRTSLLVRQPVPQGTGAINTMSFPTFPAVTPSTFGGIQGEMLTRLPPGAANRQPVPQSTGSFFDFRQPPAQTPSTFGGLQRFDIPVHALVRRGPPPATGGSWDPTPRGVDPVVVVTAPTTRTPIPGFLAGGSGGPGYTIDKLSERRRRERWLRSGFGFYKNYSQEQVQVKETTLGLNSQGEKRIILGERKPSRFDAAGKKLPLAKITTADIPPLQTRIDAILADQRASEMREHDIHDDDEDFLENYLLHGGF